MTSPLAAALVSTARREASGSRAANRFSFQLDWALCHLLALHEAQRDYVLVFDYHEDLVQLDSATPTDMVTYQIKTARFGQSWTLTRLTSQEPGAAAPKPSIVGKLYHARVAFGGAVREMNFVSNAAFSLDLADGTSSQEHDNLPGHLLSDSTRQKLAAQLAVEHQLPGPPDVDCIVFRVTHLSVKQHESHTKGRIAEFLDALSSQQSASAVYRFLTGELRRRNDDESPCGSFDDLLRRKSLSRADFEQIIGHLIAAPSPAEAWRSCEGRLTHEGVAFDRIQKLRRLWRLYEVQRADSSNTRIQLHRRSIRNTLPACMSSSIIETTNKVRLALGNSWTEDPDLLEAIALREIYDE